MQSTFVRYVRSADRVVPVRVTKQWVSFGNLNHDKRPVEKFVAVRSAEVPWGRLRDREQASEGWVSSDRVETRERVLGLFCKTASQTFVVDGEQHTMVVHEPVLYPAGEGEPCLELGDLENLTAAQAGYSLANANGFGVES